ncbi:hypothetical protein CR513_56204, partial [Mucuna pruriens]
MTFKSAKAIWDYLNGEYAGDERIRSMQVINLMREFELQRMKESETIKEYSDKLLSIANKIRLLGSDFADSRIVEKILVMVPERTSQQAARKVTYLVSIAEKWVILFLDVGGDLTQSAIGAIRSDMKL